MATRRRPVPQSQKVTARTDDATKDKIKAIGAPTRKRPC